MRSRPSALCENRPWDIRSSSWSIASLAGESIELILVIGDELGSNRLLVESDCIFMNAHMTRSSGAIVTDVNSNSNTVPGLTSHWKVLTAFTRISFTYKSWLEDGKTEACRKSAAVKVSFGMSFLFELVNTLHAMHQWKSSLENSMVRNCRPQSRSVIWLSDFTRWNWQGNISHDRKDTRYGME